MYNKHYFDIINGLVREAGAGKILEEREMAFFITICAAREGDGKKADNMQEENIKISIIVPVYNVESYIEQCLDSIRKQTYSNLEVILIDDGSVDASASVCQRYVGEDSRFQLICQKNKGASAARNRGLDQATGEYIGFVDSYDWIEPDMYERLLKIAQKEEADIVCCAFRYIKKEETIDCADDSYHIFHGKEMLESYISGSNGCLMSPAVWNRLFRRELFEGIRFTEGRMFEDKEISCRTLARIKKGVYFNHAFYNYRDNKNSVSNSAITENYVSDFVCMYRLQEKIVERYLTREFQKITTGTYYMLLLDMYCKIFKKKGMKYSRRRIATELQRIKETAKQYIAENESIPDKDKKMVALGGVSPNAYYLIISIKKINLKCRKKAKRLWEHTPFDRRREQ